jgi:tetrahydromethanopterin S-methyltransferase subunit G
MSYTRGVHVANEPVNKDDFNRHVDRHDRVHSELDARIARDMVPLGTYMSDQRTVERRLTFLEQGMMAKADDADLQPLKDRLDKVEQRPANVRNYLIALAGLGLTLLGIVVSAYFSARSGQ